MVSIKLARRVMLAGGVTIGASACAGSDSSESESESSASATASAAPSESPAGAGSEEPLAEEADVRDHPLAVTDPASGDPAFLVRVDEEVVMLSAICTHSGCSVAWRDADGEFECPCHRGRYDVTGAVLAGPPPDPLHRLPVEVRNGMVFAVDA